MNYSIVLSADAMSIMASLRHAFSPGSDEKSTVLDLENSSLGQPLGIPWEALRLPRVCANHLHGCCPNARKSEKNLNAKTLRALCVPSALFALRHAVLFHLRRLRGFIRVLGDEAPFAEAVSRRGVGDADARRAHVLRRKAVVLQPETRGGRQPLAVERARDVQELRQPAGAFRALHAANEHGFGMALVARHHVEQLVHAVAHVDVGAAARRVQDVRPGCPPLVRMAGRVLLAEVGLRLRDAPPQNRPVRQAAAEELPEQARRKRERIGREVRQAPGNGKRVHRRSMIRPSSEIVTTCHGMNLPEACNAFFAACSRPPQHGTSMRTMVTDLMSFSRMISVSFSE